MRFVVSGVLAFLLNMLFIPLIIGIAKKYQLFDKPNERKIHTAQIARLGGIGIFWSMMLSFWLSLLYWRYTGTDILRYLPVFFAMLLIHAIGLLDDFKDLRARLRFLIQLIAAFILVSFGFRFTHIWLPVVGSVSIGWFSWPLTLVWIVGVLNALNMIDGLDGLSGGISLMASLGYGLVLMAQGAVIPAMIAFSLAGALVGYLRYNLPPAKIFMGDSGSTFLGFTLAVLPLMDSGRADSGLWIWSAITLMLVPIYDVFAAMLRRKRHGVSVMSPDKWHIHHKLMYFGVSNRGILAIIYSLCALAVASTVCVLFFPPFLYWITVSATWSLVGVFFLVLHYAKENSLRKQMQK